jgi:hypothetical protein
MTEGRIGRLLPACLHQAIADVLPDRVEFYEEWLGSEGLKDRRMGLAPLSAVLGFLRTEGAAYDGVMTRAGQLAAEWTWANLPGMRRRLIRRLPRPFRMRAALRIARGLVRDVLTTSTASSRVRRGGAQFDVRASLFCTVREPQAAPLCAFYRAAAVEVLRACGIAADGTIEQCRAVGATSCVIAIQSAAGSAEPQAAAA